MDRLILCPRACSHQKTGHAENNKSVQYTHFSNVPSPPASTKLRGVTRLRPKYAIEPRRIPQKGKDGTQRETSPLRDARYRASFFAARNFMATYVTYTR
jgi:hypothetical protein